MALRPAFVARVSHRAPPAAQPIASFSSCCARRALLLAPLGLAPLLSDKDPTGRASVPSATASDASAPLRARAAEISPYENQKNKNKKKKKNRLDCERQKHKTAPDARQEGARASGNTTH